MRLALLPLCLAVAPLYAQWDLRLEVPRPTGQSLPQTLIAGTTQLAASEFDTGRGYLATVSRRLVQIGPLLKLEAGLEYSQFKAEASLLSPTTTQATTLKQQGIGLGLNAQVWVPFVGLAGEIGLIQRFQRYTVDSTGATTQLSAAASRDLSRTWLRVGARWRIPTPVVHPYLVASYQQPTSKDRPVQISSASDLTAYFTAQGSGQEFERLWTFGVGVTF